MKAHGQDVRCFGSARELLDCELHEVGACFLIDVAMPEMNGIQLLEELRRRGHREPAIFITALDDPVVRDSATQAGASAFFRKPVDGNELLAAVSRALARDPDGADPSIGGGTAE